MQTAFDDSTDDSTWPVGNGGFGTDVPGSPRVGTPWTSPDIWLRRTFTAKSLSAAQIEQLEVRDYHDEAIEVFLNGVPAYASGGYTTGYEYRALSAEARRAMVAGGENVLAVHCHQTGGQFLDVGLFLRSCLANMLRRVKMNFDR